MVYIIILYAIFFNCKIGILEFIFILFCISLLEIRIVWKILDHFACCLLFFQCFDGRRTICMGFYNPHVYVFARWRLSFT